MSREFFLTNEQRNLQQFADFLLSRSTHDVEILLRKGKTLATEFDFDWQDANEEYADWQPVIHSDVLTHEGIEYLPNLITHKSKYDSDYNFYSLMVPPGILQAMTNEKAYHHWLRTRMQKRIVAAIDREPEHSGAQSFLKHQAREIERECQYGNGAHYFGHELPDHPHTKMKVRPDGWLECPICHNAEEVAA